MTEIQESERNSDVKDSSSPIDSDIIRELRSLRDETRPTFLTDLIDTFLNAGANGVADLREAHSTGNAAFLRRIAHTLTGSSGSLGALHMSKLCAELESLAQQGQVSEAGPLVKEVEGEFARVRSALLEERSR